MADYVSHESFGQHLARLRRRRGLSQARLAELLCAASGVPTVSRNEVSRWERGRRVPARPWLAWLSQVLAAPLPSLPAPETRHGPIESKRWLVLRGQLRQGHRSIPAAGEIDRGAFGFTCAKSTAAPEARPERPRAG